MLDDLKLIHERDPQDALGVVEKQWQQLQYDYGLQFPHAPNIKNIVLSGMGGSAFPGAFIQAWPQTKVPFEIVRNYDLPAYIDNATLFISSSISGNTEETLSALAEAERRGAEIVVLTTGGKLADIARNKNYPLFLVPGGIQPRMTSFYILAALMQLLEPLGLVEAGSMSKLKEAGEWLSNQINDWKPEIPTRNNPAKQLAQELVGKSAVFYSGPKLFPAANKFKICLNENAKNVAWVNQYPEFNHNEFIGWTSHPVDKPYAVVEIRSDLEHARVQKRFEVSERVLSGKRPAPHLVVPKGDNLIKQLLWTAAFGDFTSIYLALLNGVNPTPVDYVEKLKVMLDD